MAGINLTGLDKVLKMIDIKAKEPDVQLILNDFGQRVVTDAKILVPKDEGKLGQSINTTSGKLSVTINVNADYAAYQEFGTRKFAAQYVGSLPAEYKQFAAQFKGGGSGSFQELVMRLVRWCKAKGIEESAAYPIAKKILFEGIPAQPFLIPSLEKNRQQLIKDFEDLI